jgi:O-antigen ligase
MFVFAFALWPLLAFLGMGGFSSLVGLTGLEGLIAMRPSLRVSPMTAIALALAVAWLGWATWTGTQVPGAKPLWSGSLLAGDFEVHIPALRLALVLAFAGVCAACALRLAQQRVALSRTVMLGALALSGLGVLVTAVFLEPLLNSIGTMSGSEPKAIQNALRNAIVFGLALPLLLAPLAAGARWPGWVLGGLSLLAYAAACWHLSAQAGVLMALAVSGAMGVVTLLPRRGLALLIALPGVLTALAPLWMGGVVALGQGRGAASALSDQSRLAGWQYALERIAEEPLTGHGMNAAKGWTKTFGELPGWQGPDILRDYPIMTGHPHNFPLHIWAETGAVGAILASLALLVLAWRLRDVRAMSRVGRLAAGGLAGAALIPAMVSFSVWNDGFWGALAIAACGAILLDRHARGRAGATA